MILTVVPWGWEEAYRTKDVNDSGRETGDGKWIKKCLRNQISSLLSHCTDSYVWLPTFASVQMHLIDFGDLSKETNHPLKHCFHRGDLFPAINNQLANEFFQSNLDCANDKTNIQEGKKGVTCVLKKEVFQMYDASCHRSRNCSQYKEIREDEPERSGSSALLLHPVSSFSSSFLPPFIFQFYPDKGFQRCGPGVPKSLSAAKDVPVVVHPHQRELPWKPNYPYSNDCQGSSNQHDAWFLVIRMLLQWSGVCAFDGLRTADRGKDRRKEGFT